MGKILLEGLEFFAFHGCYKSEKIIGGKYRLNVTLDYDFGKAVESDKLADTIDYGEIYRVIDEEMKISSDLIEHVAGRILNRILKEFSAIKKVSVKLSKINPPLKVKMESVSVELEKERVS